MGDKTKEQLLAELLELQKMLEEKAETQGHMIRKFQMLIGNDGLFSQIIDFFPYPIAIFTPQYLLISINKAFAAVTETSTAKLEKECIRILQYKISDVRLVSAINQVFNGNTFFLDDLKHPFSMFSQIPQQLILQSDRFKKAVIFPVPADDDVITHGVIVFMP